MTEIHTVGVLGRRHDGRRDRPGCRRGRPRRSRPRPARRRNRAGARSDRRLPGPEGREGPAGREGRDRRAGPHRPADSLEALSAADLVVEAIPEDLALKRDAFRRLDATAADGAILATNTSSLSVAAIGSVTRRPDRVVGMHFFNPVPLMALVEVIAGPTTVNRGDRCGRTARQAPRQDAGHRRRYAGLHRQSRREAVLPRGVPDRRRGRRRGRDRRRRDARDRVSDGPVRADRRHRQPMSTSPSARRSSISSSAIHGTGRTRSSARSSSPGASGARRTAAATTTRPTASAVRRGPG